MYMEEPIILGYACINTELKAHDIYVNRTCILKNFSIKKAKKLALKNLNDMRRIIIWNELCGIKFYRMSSGLFPHITNHLIPSIENNNSVYTLDFAKNTLKNIGKLVKKFGHRVTFHPGQFNQLGTSDQEILKRTINELDMHCQILDTMELDNNSICIIHGGGSYGDKNGTLKILEKNILALPSHIKDRLCLENDEFVYGVTDLLPLCEKIMMPFCFDFFHHSIKNDTKITEDLMMRVVNTWLIRGMFPKFHISEQKPDGKIGAHGDMISSIPKILFILPELCKTKIYITIEAKYKEQAVFKLLKKYFNRYNVGRKIYYIPKVLDTNKNVDK